MLTSTLGLNDGRWHTVVLRVGDDSDDVTISVTHGDASSTATIGQNELVATLKTLFSSLLKLR